MLKGVAIVVLATFALPAAAHAANPVPAFLQYERPAAYEAVVTNDIEVPLRDGSHLSCDLYRPGTSASEPAPGRFPGVVYQYHDYGVNRTVNDVSQDEFLAQHGYNALECSVRGIGGSPGTFEPLGPLEARDGYDIVEWLATQPWADGRIGMVGYSYGAITAYMTAGLRPPHLLTIVPQASYQDLYLDIAHLGGVRGADVRGYILGVILALNATGTPPDQMVGIETSGAVTDQAWGSHLLRDPFWDQYKLDFAAIKASGIPILGFGGWYDIYQRGMPAVYGELPAQTWLVMQNVAHVDTGDTFYGKATGPTLAWLDAHVMGLPAPLPPTHVTSFEMPAGGGHGWTPFSAWPPPESRPAQLHMNADGTLTPTTTIAGTSAYAVDPSDGMPSYWNVGARPDSAELVAANTRREAERTHFTTPALTEDIVLAGTPHAHINAAFSADDGYLVARLGDVAPDGSVTLVGTGWAQASLPPPYDRRVDVAPGKSGAYDVEIWPSHWRFAAGHRLQLSISSGDVPRIHPDAPPGTVTIDTGGSASSLSLPILGPAASAAPVGPSAPAALQAIAGCPRATGRLSRSRLGRIRLGQTRARVLREYPSRIATVGRRGATVTFCLAGGAIRTAFLRGRLAIALTANRHYSLRGLRPGDRLRLRPGRRYRIGKTTWHVDARGGVLRVRGGVVREVGIARRRAVTRALLRRLG